ncbi:unnamed protein product [Fusarium graminearum]|uniref:Uncharacterized protein n=1 Tax=Gibberella zeae TaxID=5518 RepID=A0A9N8NCP2_GIBZA|nr:unnamed protein product [Fusarium graminearum]CAG1966928.1 unnamed protein product [Fusarium graminearum]CAG1976565.1 unnamed protein product [Fusarium graminearum]
MLTQTRLNVSPSGQLIFYRPNPLPKYPLLDRPIPWPKLCCHNDSSILKAPELNAKVPLLQLPDELLQSILRSVVQKPLEFALGYDAYWDVYWDSIAEDDVPNWGPEKGWARQASFTKLQFYNLHARPESVKVFLEWPKELHEFAITLAGNMEYHEPNPAFRWNHNRLADVLSSQKDYLRVLDVGWLGHDRDQNSFPVSTFQNLHTMALCIAYKKPSEESCQNWLTPSLHTLILDLHDSGQCGPSSFRCMDKGNAQRIAEWAGMARRWADDNVEETMLGERRMKAGSSVLPSQAYRTGSSMTIHIYTAYMTFSVSGTRPVRSPR